MEISPCICNICQQISLVKDTGIQTDLTLLFSPLSSPNCKISAFSFKLPSANLVRINACIGDIDESCELFNESDFSSIHANDSIDTLSIAKLSHHNPLHPDTYIHSPAEITSKPKKSKLHSSRTARQSPDIFKKEREDLRILSITPSLYSNYSQARYAQELENEELSESYEIILNKFSGKDPDNLKQCFRNLVKFEKIAVRESFSKRSS